MSLSPEAAAINASIVASVLTMRATIYGRTGGTGPYNAVLRSDLSCRLDRVEGGRQPAATAAERRELARLGTFRWDAEYELPESSIQIEVDAYPSKRWNPVAATSWPDDVPGIGVIGRSCDVVLAA